MLKANIENIVIEDLIIVAMAFDNVLSIVFFFGGLKVNRKF